jgi:putative two-component system response regulator
MAPAYEILIVDDVSENIKVAISILKRDDYNFSYALNGKQAIKILKTKRFDLILLDVLMPQISGFDLCKIIKNSPAIKDTPIIFLTAKELNIESVAYGFELGAVDFVAKPFHPVELKSRVATHLELYRYRQSLKISNKKLNSEIVCVKNQHFTDLEIAQKELLYILSDIMESDSGETACHVKRVAIMAQELAALEGNLSDDEIKMINLAAPLHDIGKLLVDNSILHKQDALTDDEFTVMKEHPEYAMKILKKSDRKLIKVAKVIAYKHHENYDGSGYPRGLKGDEIHIYARIVAIVDVLDALTQKRSYKEAWTFEEATQYIHEQSAKKFDPSLVSIFMENLEVFKKIIEEEIC